MEIFSEALRSAGARRQAYLDRACEDNALLRAEVESLLAIRQRLGGFLGSPTLEGEAQVYRGQAIRGNIDSNPASPL